MSKRPVVSVCEPIINEQLRQVLALPVVSPRAIRISVPAMNKENGRVRFVAPAPSKIPVALIVGMHWHWGLHGHLTSDQPTPGDYLRKGTPPASRCRPPAGPGGPGPTL